MKMNEYQTLAQRTCNITNAPDDKIMNDCLRLARRNVDKLRRRYPERSKYCEE